MRFRLIISWLLVILVSLLVFGSIGVYSVVNLIPKYEHKAEVILSEKLGAKVDFKIDKIRWKGIHPEIHITRFEIQNSKNGYSAYVGDIVIKLDIIGSLLAWQPSADSIDVDNLRVKFNLDKVENLSNGNLGSSENNASPQAIENSVMDILKLLTGQSNIKFNNTVISFGKQGTVVDVPIKLDWTELSYHHYQLEAQAVIEGQKKNNLYLNVSVHNSIFSGLQAQGQLKINLSNVGGYIRSFSNFGYDVQHGNMAVGLNFSILHNRMSDINGHIEANDVEIKSPKEQILQIKKFVSYFNYFADDRLGSMAKLANISIDVYEHTYNIQDISLFIGDQDENKKYKIKMTNFNLSLIDNLYKPLTSFLDIKEIKSLTETKFSGDINDLQAEINVSSKKIQNWKIYSRLNNINFNKEQNALIAKNVSGEVYLSSKNGWLRLDSNNFSFGGKGIFEKPIPPVKLTGFVNWENVDNIWLLNVHNIGFNDNDDLGVQAYGSISIPENNPDNTIVSVFGYVNGDEIGQRFKSFLPTIGVDPELYDWLTKTISTVHKANATFLLDGPITKMPFQHNEGDFNIILNVNNAAFNPYYEWPLISDVNARLWIKNPKVEIFGTQGKSENAEVKHASFLVPNMSPGVPSYMLIKGEIEAKKEESGLYLQNSPLAEDLGMLVHNLYYVGGVNLDLSMQFPLGDPDGSRDIKGIAKLKGGTALVQTIGTNVYDLNGSVQFHNDAYTIKGISGWLDPYSPVLFSMSSDQISEDQYAYHGNIKANIPLEKITNKVPDILANNLSGYMPLLASFEISDANGGSIHFITNLMDVKSQLPIPLKINIQEKLPVFYGKVGWDKAFNLLNADIHYDDISIVGTVDISKIDRFPIIANINIPMVDAESWVDFYKNSNQKIVPLAFTNNKLENWEQYQPYIGSEYSNSWFCQNMSANIACLAKNTLYGVQPFIDILVGNVTYGKYNFKNISLTTSSTPEAINISASRDDKEQIEVDVPITGYRPWNLDVRNINIKKPKSSGSSGDKNVQESDNIEIDAQKLSLIPPANISVKNLKVLDRNVHDSTFKITPIPKGIAIPLFMLRDVGNSMVLGDAKFYGKPVNGYLSVNASSNNWGQLLSYYGYPDILEGGNGPVSAELNWVGSYLPEVSTLSGHLAFNIKDGVINKIKPGLAKLIGIFSINTYLARLATSYSDFTTTGMMFNKIMGKYSMVDGYAETSPRVEIATPSFDALVTGSVNFKDSKIDQKIKLQPHLAGAVAIAAGAVGMLGGPIIGVGIGLVTYVVEEIVTNTLLKNTGLITLYITGDLNDPKVTKQAL